MADKEITNPQNTHKYNTERVTAVTLSVHLHMKKIPLLLMFPGVLLATLPKIEADLNVQSGYYSNIFNSVIAGSQKFIYFDGLLNYPLQKSINLYGGVDGVFYNPTESYSNVSIEGGLFGYKKLNENILVNGGLYFSTERFESTFDYYNSENFGGYGNLTFYFQSQFNGKVGYSFEKSTYNQLDGIDNIDHQLYLKMTRSFDFGTSIMGYASFGTQQFDSFLVQSSFGISRPGRPISNRGTSEIKQFESNRIATLRFRLAQSITDKAGIALTVEHKDILDLNADIVYFDQYFYNPLQDRYQWQGDQVDLKMTFMPKHDLQLVAASSFRVRSFDNNPVYDYDMDSQSYILDNGEYILLDNSRTDENAKIQVSLEKLWFRDIFEFEKNIGLTFTAGYAMNMSNDPIYNSSGLYSFLSLQYYY